MTAAVVPSKALETWRPTDIPAGWILRSYDYFVDHDWRSGYTRHTLRCEFQRIHVAGEEFTVPTIVDAAFSTPDECVEFITKVLPWLATHPAANVRGYQVAFGN